MDGLNIASLAEYISKEIEKLPPELEHYGVKGMKWGVRKTEAVVLTRKLKSGETLTVVKENKAPIAKALSRVSSRYKNYTDSFHSFKLSDGNGKNVGEAYFRQDSPTSLNLMWVGVKTKHRGKGYATAVMEGVVNYAKDNNITKLTLEVPGNSPDALHIYEKIGFKTTDQLTNDNDMWGGLTNMEMDLKTLKHSEFDNVLIHHGVKGMKWGVRRSQKALDRAANRRTAESREASELKKKPASALTNAELKRVNERMNLEQNYARLNPKKVKVGMNYVKGSLAVAGTAVAAYNLINSPAGQTAIKAGKAAVKSAKIVIRAKRAFG